MKILKRLKKERIFSIEKRNDGDCDGDYFFRSYNFKKGGEYHFESPLRKKDVKNLIKELQHLIK